MLITLLVISLYSVQTFAQSKITLNVTDTNLEKVVSSMATQSGYKFFYDEPAAAKLHISRLTFNNITVEEALRRIHQAHPVSFKILRNEVTLQIETNEQFNQRQQQERPGKISGKILDDKGEHLPGASISITSLGQHIQSAADGSYQAAVKPGTYTLEVSFIGYQTKRITDVVVRPDKTTALNIVLKTGSRSLNAVTVTATYKKASIEGLYARQKNNPAMSDGITAEQINRTPDNNTAQVLKRISGLQVTDNKYVVVRGLSDRYNNVLLNGATLPSSEPNKRNFAFDMIPSAILDRVIVNKTATPDLSGEFAGGLVQVETKDIPAEDFLQITVGTGYNTQSTGKEMHGLDHGDKAWLGLSSDVHKKPGGMTWGQYSALQSKVDRNAPATDPNRQKMHQFLSSMPDNWAIRKYTAAPVQNYQLQLGKVFDFKEHGQFGLIAGVSYRNEQSILDRKLNVVWGSDFEGDESRYTTAVGGTLNMGYRLKKHKFTFQNTYNQRFSDNMWHYTGFDGDNSNARHDSYTNVTIINRLTQSQLSGEHSLGKRGIKADWFASMAQVDRDQPYSRLLARLNGTDLTHYPDDYFSYDVSDLRLKSGTLFYSELKEKSYNWAANIQLPFKWLQQNQSFKAGYQGKYRSADFGANLYRMLSFNGDNLAYTGVPYNKVFSRQNFATDLYLLAVNGQGRKLDDAESTEGYEGTQRLHAYYAMFDLKPLTKLRIITGVRAESNEQEVSDYYWDAEKGAYTPRLLNNKETNWLPSANVIYSFTDKLNLRAAYYKTIARPDFREMSTFSYWDYDFFAPVSGTPLKTTRIENADLRLEYYPASGEIISISGFYKKFKDPIELLYNTTSSSIAYNYMNLEGAIDKGIEVDFRKSLHFISPASAFLSNLYVSGNFTWLDANVNFYPDEAKDENGNYVYPKRDRPLTGQSPYIVNAGLLYAGSALSVNLSYNRYGKRIVFASPDRSTDEYEKTRDLLDLQVSYKFLKEKRAEVKLNVNDIFNQEQIFYQNRYSTGNDVNLIGTPSVERYPGGGETLPENLIDPKGTSYNSKYDHIVRRYRFGTTYTFNFIYRF